jgi:hypothetical protein
MIKTHDELKKAEMQELSGLYFIYIFQIPVLKFIPMSILHCLLQLYDIIICYIFFLGN